MGRPISWLVAKGELAISHRDAAICLPGLLVQKIREESAKSSDVVDVLDINVVQIGEEDADKLPRQRLESTQHGFEGDCMPGEMDRECIAVISQVKTLGA